jgi:hypothetical protein
MEKGVVYILCSSYDGVQEFAVCPGANFPGRRLLYIPREFPIPTFRVVSI